MVDFDIKSQLDLLNVDLVNSELKDRLKSRYPRIIIGSSGDGEKVREYLDREMEASKTEYFVVKPNGKRSSNRPTIVNGNASTSCADGSLDGCALDRQLPPSRLCSWEAYRCNSESFPQTATKKRSKAIDIIDPETGETVQLL